jgi:hypothetical protein
MPPQIRRTAWATFAASADDSAPETTTVLGSASVRRLVVWSWLAFR